MIQSLTERILDLKPEPAVHCRLLMDVNHLPPEGHELDRSRWVKVLAAEQREDGSSESLTCALTVIMQ